METSIGVFASRGGAEQAVKALLDERVPQECIVFLTRSEGDAKAIGKTAGAYVGGMVGGSAGLSLGVAAATVLMVPGIGQVFALGIGAAALLGLAGLGAGAAVGNATSSEPNRPEPTANARGTEDASFFRDVLKEGRSLVIVRTESKDTASAASAILDRMGLGTQGRTPTKMNIATREADGIAIVDISGRITIGEGDALRETIRELVVKGNKQILLNLGEVEYVDSSGIGELVGTYTTVRNKGGELKLVNLSKRVHDLLQMTRLINVFKIEKDEQSAIKSFRGSASSEAVA